jgi:hypothetical protein
MIQLLAFFFAGAFVSLVSGRLAYQRGYQAGVSDLRDRLLTHPYLTPRKGPES